MTKCIDYFNPKIFKDSLKLNKAVGKYKKNSCTLEQQSKQNNKQVVFLSKENVKTFQSKTSNRIQDNSVFSGLLL